MKIKKISVIFLLSLLVIILVSVVFVSIKVKNQVKELFKLNRELQKEGYYMADFEFRMLGFSYLLDKGQYFDAIKELSEYHERLKNRKGLLKIPRFENNREEMDFFLNLQDPNTGAFIDESAQYCVYWEVTQNILSHLESLTDSATAPLKLNYPLKFLDEINEPGKLTAFLNDISFVGPIASKFPQTTFHFARNMLVCAAPGNVLERNQLYSFSPEWKHTMLAWMYNVQDSTTGMWGPKNRKSGKLLKYDLNNTASILKAFRDSNGNDIYSEFPLQYPDKIISTSLAILSEQYPGNDEDLAEIHEWNLKTVKGIKMLLRYLWNDATAQNKLELKKILDDFIQLSFDKYYVKAEGAFSYYPNAKHASADGFSNMIFDDIGSFSYKKQKKLFGEMVDSVPNFGVLSISDLDSFIQKISKSGEKIISIRIYSEKPDFTNLTKNVKAIYYPQKTSVLDIMELVPDLIAWADTTSIAVGNWTSVAREKSELEKLEIKKPLVIHENLSEYLVATNENFYCVGFNVLQLPEFMLKCSF